MDKMIVESIKEYWHKDGHLNGAQRDFLIEKLSALEPQYCLETGFATGRSCVTTLFAAKPQKLVSVDADLDYMKARDFAAKLERNFENLTIIEGRSDRVLTEDFFQKEFPDGIDYAFVDGGHSYEVAYFDISTIYPHLNPDGLMIVDDYRSGKPDGFTCKGVDKAVDEYVKKKNIEMVSWNHRGKGFALLKK